MILVLDLVMQPAPQDCMGDACEQGGSEACAVHWCAAQGSACAPHVLLCSVLQNMYIKEDGAAVGGGKRARTTGSYSGTSTGGYEAGSKGASYAPVSNTKDNPPCNTLFIGNLSDSVDEGELQGLFGAQPVSHRLQQQYQLSST